MRDGPEAPDERVGARIQEAWRTARQASEPTFAWSRLYLAFLNQIHRLDLTERDADAWPPPAYEITLERLVSDSWRGREAEGIEDLVWRALDVPERPGAVREWIVRHTPRLRDR